MAERQPQEDDDGGARNASSALGEEIVLPSPSFIIIDNVREKDE